MARAFLAAVGSAWILTAVAAIGVALLGIERLEGMLPPLAIDAAALGRSVIALAVAALLVGGAHLAVVAGLARGRSWAASAGILLGGVSIAGFLALVAAALTAAAAGSMGLLASVLVALGGLGLAAGYGVTTVVLAHRLRSRPPT